MQSTLPSGKPFPKPTSALKDKTKSALLFFGAALVAGAVFWPRKGKSEASWLGDHSRTVQADPDLYLWLREPEGAWYVYGAGEPATALSSWPEGTTSIRFGEGSYRGWDCSGLAQAVGVRGGWLKTSEVDRSANSLFNWMEKVAPGDQVPGDIAFYGSSRAIHATVILTYPDNQGISEVLSASGYGDGNGPLGRQVSGGSSVRSYDSHLYRSDFIGIRRWPGRQVGTQDEIDQLNTMMSYV